jgi:Lon protease-like protein
MTPVAGSTDLPATIPVFPLAGALLLPRAMLPLHIFEPRYLAMIDAALAAPGRLVGILQPDGEGGPTGSPQARSAGLRTIGCAGRITSFQEVQGGRYMIVLTGVSRFTTVEEVNEAEPFRSFRVDWSRFASDLKPGHGEEEVDRERLLEVMKRYLATRQLTADWREMGKTGSEMLVNALCVASPFAPAEKQALLECRTTAERAQTLVALAEMALAAGTDDDGSQRRMQ